MNDQPIQSHHEWEELAAAYALDALDPQDELRLSAHVATCARCQQSLDDYNLVAAQLGSLADDEEAPPSWRQIRSAVVGDQSAGVATSLQPEQNEDRSPDGIAPVVPLPQQSSPAPLWRRPRMMAAAAAVVLLVAGGLAGWKLTSRSSPTSATAAVTACQQQAGCRVVKLRTPAAVDSAAVIVDSGHASVVPLALDSAPVGRMYVLWQLPRDGGGMIPIESFRQTRHQTVGSQLPHAYADTAAFAVSLEPAGGFPTRPSDILALGAAS
jgi:hypothetical protein